MDDNVTCEYCGNPMQLADTLMASGEVTARRYVCYCSGVLKHKTIHEGQQKETR